ncbi:MAG: hypothetical protein ACI86M_001608 [Saprospiraceae bacterium]|jgi:hypothetical protein
MTYEERKIEFLQVVKYNQWSIKIYTITNKESFSARGLV